MEEETYYKVKWVGSTKQTWEPEDNLFGAQDAIDNFLLEEKSRIRSEFDSYLKDFYFYTVLINRKYLHVLNFSFVSIQYVRKNEKGTRRIWGVRGV